MTRPHEEAWTYDGRWIRRELADASPTIAAFDYSTDGGDDARGRLAAQAPAMARALLDLYTDGHLTETGSRECVSCAATWRERITGKSYEPIHYDHCEFASVLRAAGVLP